MAATIDFLFVVIHFPHEVAGQLLKLVSGRS